MKESSIILPSATEMQAMDLACIAAGTTSIELMERAGQAIFKHVIGFESQNTLIFCGSGNNGGDGLVLARLLLEAGHAIKVILVSAKQYSSENLLNLRRLLELSSESVYCFLNSINIPECENIKSITAEILVEWISSSDLIVEALLGAGQLSHPRDGIKQLIELINQHCKCNAIKLAVDVPAGVNCSSGFIYNPVFTATHTIAVQFIKRGLLQYPARTHCGKISTISIGILPVDNVKYRQLTADNLVKIIRKPDSHKGKSGNLLVIGSENGMPGATVLTCQAALKIGAGTVTRVVPRLSLYPSYCWPEVMHFLVGTEATFFDKDLLELLVLLESADAVVIGPGMSSSSNSLKFVRALLEHLECPAVIDAGALSAFKQDISNASIKIKDNWVLTPHPGELANILRCSVPEVQSDRYLAFDRFTATNSGVLVFKGASTIVGNSIRAWVNTTGNSAMATAGMGDVLAGMIGGLLAQGLTALNAANLAVYVHGKVADLVLSEQRSPLIASVIIEQMSRVLVEGYFQFE